MTWFIPQLGYDDETDKETNDSALTISNIEHMVRH